MSSLRCASMLLALSASACRSTPAQAPPLHLNGDMDRQSALRPQRATPLFADRRAMRPQPRGTIAVGQLYDNLHLHTGRRGGRYAKKLAVKADRQLLMRGRERYEIFCSPCHGYTGDSKDGAMPAVAGEKNVPSLLSQRAHNMALGRLFDVISNGNPPLRKQVPVRDRWAIAAYVRVLQVAATQPLARVPRATRQARGWTE